MTKYFHFVLAKHRNDIEHKGKRLEGSPPHPHPVFSVYWGRHEGNGYVLEGGGEQYCWCCPIYASAGGEGWQGGGARQKPLANRSEKGTNPGPHSRQSCLPRGDRARSQSSPGWQERAAAASRPGAEDQPPPAAARRRRARRRTAPRRRMRLAPAAERKQLTQRRGARLLPGEHAPATGDSSSVREKACAPPPGFRARS